MRSPKEFRESLLRGHDFVRTVTEEMLTYALGLGVEHYDAPIVQQLVRGLERDEYRWSELVLGIVLSRPFQMRRALGEGPTVKRASAAERRQDTPLAPAGGDTIHVTSVLDCLRRIPILG